MILFENWKDLSKEQVLNDFSNDKKNIRDEFPNFDFINIMFGYYSYEHYEGRAFLLYEENGKLYEVNGSHCSCNGLEGTWSPEETNVQALRFRMENGKLGLEKNYNSDTNKYELESIFKDELNKLFHSLEFKDKFKDMINE